MMKNKVYCEVCQVKFIFHGQVKRDQVIVCTVCGAELKIEEVQPDVRAVRFSEDPEKEIRTRVSNFASLRGYVFNEDKELVVEGLVEKHNLFGDFYCPCRFENDKENVCPCLETRMNAVKKHGRCY